MESEWEFDRIHLYQFRREHPEWTLKQLAQIVGRCLSRVKKWLKRISSTKCKQETSSVGAVLHI